MKKIDQIKERAGAWKDLPSHKLYQGHLANTAAKDRKKLLIQVAVLEKTAEVIHGWYAEALEDTGYLPKGKKPGFTIADAKIEAWDKLKESLPVDTETT